MTGSRPAGPVALAAGGCGVLSVLTLAVVAAAGDSVAGPGLGAGTWTPPWDAGLAPSPGLVTVALAVACLLGGAAVGLGLVAVRRGARLGAGPMTGRRAATLAGVAVAVLVCVPPLGSADHLSYAAYGRIAAQGDDPYLVAPIEWRGGTDPVAGAVQPPWQRTPSIYGPVATAVQAGAAWVGDGSLRLTVWCWQLVAGSAFLLTGRLLDRLTRADPAARARAAVLWTFNPLLLGQLVLGAHLDVLAAAAALAGLALAARSAVLQWTVGGAALGVAAGIKAPYALVGLAVCWGLGSLARQPGGARQGWRRAGWGLLGALLVLVPAHLWAGPHSYDQVGRATRFVSFATPWRLLIDHTGLRPVVRPAALLLAVLLAVLLARGLARQPTADRQPTDLLDPVRRSAATAAVVLCGAWVLSVPYALPWYDAMVWAFLPLVPAGRLDGVLLARLGVLAVAYVPGRVTGLTDQVERVTLGFRREVAPWLLLAGLIAVVLWSLSGSPRSRQPADGPRPARAPGR